MPPKSEADKIRQDVLTECDRVIGLGREGAKLTPTGVAKATGWSRTVIYGYNLHNLIHEKERERRQRLGDRKRSRDERIAELHDALVRAQEENDRLRAQILLLEENAVKEGVAPDKLYQPVELPPRRAARSRRDGRTGPKLV